MSKDKAWMRFRLGRTFTRYDRNCGGPWARRRRKGPPETPPGSGRVEAALIDLCSRNAVLALAAMVRAAFFKVVR